MFPRLINAPAHTQGIIKEFGAPHGAPGAVASPPDAATRLANTANGLWALVLAAALLSASLASRRARHWRFLRGWARGALADYGCPLAFVAVTALSFALRAVPGAPRRVTTPNTWELGPSSFLVGGRMAQVPPEFVAAALVPALVIAVLFFFDHNVSSQMAQQKEFNLRRPPAYHYDFLLLGLLVSRAASTFCASCWPRGCCSSRLQAICAAMESGSEVF
jgi:hypothetical protein